jgi:hypothetical protein
VVYAPEGLGYRLPMRQLVTLLLCLIASPALAQPEITASTEFKDWHVECRADGYCVATPRTKPGSAKASNTVLHVGRQAQQSYWELGFTAPAAEGAAERPFTITVDGQHTTFAGPAEVGAYGRPADFYFLGKKAQAVMDRMTPDGKSMTIAFADVGGAEQAVTFSLAGLSAAMYWVDEQQNRIGSERVAEVPPYGLTPAGGEAALPPIPIDLLDRHRADPECSALEEIANGRDYTIDRLDEAQTVYVVPCWSGAGNAGWKVYVGEDGAFVPQYFAGYSSETGWTGTPFVVNYGYEPATRTIVDFSKGSGAGLCGSQGKWRWTGRAFRLIEMRYRPCGDGDTDPELPVIYSAPVQ